MNPKNTVAEALDSAVRIEEAQEERFVDLNPGFVVEQRALEIPRAHADGESELATPEESVTREQRRSRRKRDVRARTISVKRMTKRELELGRMLYPDVDGEARPKNREHCIGAERPCAYVSCKHHLYLDVSARTGAIKLNFPDLDVWEMKDSCALDVSDRGGTTLEEVGAIMNLTRERIRQVEVKGLAKLQALKEMESLRDYIDEGPVGKRRLPVIEAKDEDEDEDDVDADSEVCDASNTVSEAGPAGILCLDDEVLAVSPDLI
jgi:Sigma-70, region 4